jgi:hypothetical protein
VFVAQRALRSLRAMFQQMPPVRNLPRLPSATANRVRITVGAGAANDVRSRVLTQPGNNSFWLALGRQGNGTLAFQIRHNPAKAMPTA